MEKLEADRLKDLDTFKTKLFTNLTHEFRTPLTVILGMTGQIRENPVKYLRQSMQLIENNANNLLRLINQLLDLSKLEHSAFHLHPQQGDIIPFLRYVTESFQSYANGKNLSLRFFCTTESLVMDYDQDQIKQVLTNLISNAVKFTPSGGEVRVRASEINGTFELEVADTGIGIAEKDIPHVFSRFYRAENSASMEEYGTGIGLAHTQELLKLMGGSIFVKSRLGEGTHFVVHLPIRRQAPVIHSFKTKEGSLNSQPRGKTGLPQLLIIEDNPDLVIYLESILHDYFELDIAYNGAIGMEKAQKSVPDLIISDVMMPGKDGFEICEILKKDERTSHIPIILLTARTDVESRIAGLRRGADAYLAKPFEKEELMVRLEMLLERQKRMAAWFSRTLHGEPASPAPDIVNQESFQTEDAFVQKIRDIVNSRYADESFSIIHLARELGMSRSQLFRKMMALVNTPPSEFIRSYRLAKAKELLATTDLPVSEIAWKVGFKNPGHFSRSFQEAFGHAPRATRK